MDAAGTGSLLQVLGKEALEAHSESSSSARPIDSASSTAEKSVNGLPWCFAGERPLQPQIGEGFVEIWRGVHHIGLPFIQLLVCNTWGYPGISCADRAESQTHCELRPRRSASLQLCGRYPTAANWRKLAKFQDCRAHHTKINSSRFAL